MDSISALLAHPSCRAAGPCVSPYKAEGRGLAGPFLELRLPATASPHPGVPLLLQRVVGGQDFPSWLDSLQALPLATETWQRNDTLVTV